MWRKESDQVDTDTVNQGLDLAATGDGEGRGARLGARKRRRDGVNGARGREVKDGGV